MAVAFGRRVVAFLRASNGAKVMIPSERMTLYRRGTFMMLVSLVQ